MALTTKREGLGAARTGSVVILVVVVTVVGGSKGEPSSTKRHGWYALMRCPSPRCAWRSLETEVVRERVCAAQCR